MPPSPHRQRVLTACVLLPVLVAAVMAGGDWLFMVVLAASGLGLWEFYGLFWAGRAGRGKKVLGLALAAAFLLAARWEDPHLIVGVVMAAFWAGNLFFLACYARKPQDAHYLNALILVGGLLYLPFTMHFFLFFSPLETAVVLLAAMMSDTGAYYAGTRFGRHAMCPSVSPKKTWEGSLGGLAACVLAVPAVGLMWGQAPWWAWLLLAVALNVAAQLGDLFESALKRHQAVKDSGSLLPGHGGILDRLDSVLLVTPVYAASRALMDFFPR